MNAAKYLSSRLGKTIELIKKAYLSDKHICILVCNEPQFVKDVIQSASIMPNFLYEKKDGFVTMGTMLSVDGKSVKSILTGQSNPIIAMATDDNNEIDDMERLFFYYDSPSYNHEDKLSGNPLLPVIDLWNYVNIYSGLEQVGKQVNAKKLHLLKNSLILVHTCSAPQIPEYLAPYTETIVVPFMEEKEFNEFVSLFLKTTEMVPTTIDADGYETITNKKYLKMLYHNLRGMNASQIESVLKKNQKIFGHIYSDNDKDPMFDKLLRNIKAEFEKIIGNSRALSLEMPSDNVPAGLGDLSRWLDEHEKYVNDKAHHETARYEMEPSKGILVSGIPGSGKSMMAKFVANKFGLSLIKFDFGNLGGQYVGVSEKNMDEALDMINALSPCVLWVDEMEKAFPKAGAGNNDSEVTKRLFGKFLTWMQERSRMGVSCFVFATANDISQMPPELFRSGRFDDKFFTFMPTADDCAAIFSSIIETQNKKHGNSLQDKPLFNTRRINGALFKELLNNRDLCLAGYIGDCENKEVNQRNKFFTGSDIEQLIKNAKVKYLNNYVFKADGGNSSNDAEFDSDLFIVCLTQAIKEIRTYGETNLDDIAKCYAQLAANNFKSASSNMVLPFEGYDKLSYITRRKGEGQTYLYDLNRCMDEKKHFASLNDRYDKCLYLIIRNTINKMADIITNRY